MLRWQRVLVSKAQEEPSSSLELRPTNPQLPSMLRVALYLFASLFPILGYVGSSLPSSWAPCQARVSKILIDDREHLIMLCAGTCPQEGYDCRNAAIDFAEPIDPGWWELCLCKDACGQPHPDSPPCIGMVYFDPELYGQEGGGYTLWPCPTAENCGPVGNPRYCQGIVDMDDVPWSPTQAPLCHCPPP